MRTPSLNPGQTFDKSRDAGRRENIARLIAACVCNWGPSGLDMSAFDLPCRIDRYSDSATIKRIAVTEVDVGQRAHLPSFDTGSESKDLRHKWFWNQYCTRCWELDALSPVAIRQRSEAEITAHLDVESWNRVIEVESVEMQSTGTFLADWNRISGQATK